MSSVTEFLANNGFGGRIIWYNSESKNELSNSSSFLSKSWDKLFIYVKVITRVRTVICYMYRSQIDGNLLIMVFFLTQIPKKVTNTEISSLIS